MSKAFKFSLDTALQHRKRLEQNAQLALARTVQGRNAVVAEIARLQTVRRGAARHSNWYGGPVDASSRMNQLIFLDRSVQQIGQLLTQVRQWDERIQRARAALLEASQRRMALERLRERRLLEYGELQRQIMDRDLDELSTMRYARQTDKEGDVNAPLIS
jgi:flagellar export protein FliJ